MAGRRKDDAAADEGPETRGPATESKGATYAAPALEKGLDILEALCRSETGMTQKELAAHLGRSISEIYRMLNVLVRRDYVGQRGDRFSVTTKMYQLSRIHPPIQRLLAEAMPIMQELSRLTGFCCDLRVYNMGSSTVIAATEPPTGIGFAVRTGAEIEIAPSAAGRILVGLQDAETMEQRLGESLRDSAPAEIRAFRKDVHEVAVQGFASLRSRQYEGLWTIAFPVLDITGHAVAAMTVAMVPRIDGVRQAGRAEVETALREAALRLSDRIR